MNERLRRSSTRIVNAEFVLCFSSVASPTNKASYQRLSCAGIADDSPRIMGEGTRDEFEIRGCRFAGGLRACSGTATRRDAAKTGVGDCIKVQRRHGHAKNLRSGRSVSSNRIDRRRRLLVRRNDVRGRKEDLSRLLSDAPHPQVLALMSLFRCWLGNSNRIVGRGLALFEFGPFCVHLLCYAYEIRERNQARSGRTASSWQLLRDRDRFEGRVSDSTIVQAASSQD
ncbi:hypothetical protein SCHPADRAFT_562536 [Schizopora paradoxa]|uniref:Uncharacterized protein n=1 Tax=Schizopora paradoxa TaxID=27342 RepID=A0A0H2RCB9_9AGAM|nr:hypothetical protein SCHPADRAFT_562536 [Schizopora paradoxa]